MFIIVEKKQGFPIVGINMKAIHKPGYICYPVVWKNKQPTVTMLGKEIVVDIHKLDVLRW